MKMLFAIIVILMSQAMQAEVVPSIDTQIQEDPNGLVTIMVTSRDVTPNLSALDEKWHIMAGAVCGETPVNKKTYKVRPEECTDVIVVEGKSRECEKSPAMAFGIFNCGE